MDQLESIRMLQCPTPQPIVLGKNLDKIYRFLGCSRETYERFHALKDMYLLSSDETLRLLLDVLDSTDYDKVAKLRESRELELGSEALEELRANPKWRKRLEQSGEEIVRSDNGRIQ